MGLLSRLLAHPAARTRIEPPPPEARSTVLDFGPGWAALGNMARLGGANPAGQPVNARMAENLVTLLACVNAIASAMASLPALCYLRTAAGRQEAPNHPVARLTRQPNARQTWADWIEWTLAQALLHGNALSAVEHDGAGQVMALHPLPWSGITVQLLPSGRLAYDQASGKGPPRRYLEGEVFHLRDRSDDGTVGRSRLSRAPDLLGNAAALQEWTGSMWRNQATPGGVLSVDGSMDAAQYERLTAYMESRFAGPANARRFMVADRGAKWTPLAVSPEDAEVLASRKFTVEELCRLYQVPPPIIQSYEHNTFTNAAQASLWFAQLTLAPWARKIEAEFSRSLFGAASPYSLEIDLSGLMRGDFAARWEAWQIAVSSNILDANEVREAEGYAPRATPPPPAGTGAPGGTPEPGKGAA